MKLSFILLFIALLFKQTTTTGQVLIFSKSKSQHRVYKTQNLTFTLLDGTEDKGRVNSVSLNSIVINTKDKGEITLDNSNIKSFSERRHIWYLGARMRSLITYKSRHNVEGYKYKIKE
jgi:hypothetical protein